MSAADTITEPATDSSRIGVLLSLKSPDGSPATQEQLIAALRILRRQSQETGAGDEEVLRAIAEHVQAASRIPRSRAYYRVNAVRKLTGQVCCE